MRASQTKYEWHCHAASQSSSFQKQRYCPVIASSPQWTLIATTSYTECEQCREVASSKIGRRTLSNMPVVDDESLIVRLRFFPALPCLLTTPPTCASQLQREDQHRGQPTLAGGQATPLRPVALPVGRDDDQLRRQMRDPAAAHQGTVASSTATLVQVCVRTCSPQGFAQQLARRSGTPHLHHGHLLPLPTSRAQSPGRHRRRRRGILHCWGQDVATTTTTTSPTLRTLSRCEPRTRTPTMDILPR